MEEEKQIVCCYPVLEARKKMGEMCWRWAGVDDDRCKLGQARKKEWAVIVCQKSTHAYIFATTN